MKKLMAFLTALVLFIGTAAGYQWYVDGHLVFHNNKFGTWSSRAKFTSKAGIEENLNEHSLVVYGSSELQRGAGTPYFPDKVFEGFEFNPMLIGAGHYQSLNHAVSLSSMAEKIPNKKVVLILSPQWFTRGGVKDKAYAYRFSEMNFLGMLENKKLSSKTKKYMVERTNRLLQADPPTLQRVKLFERVLYTKNASPMDKIYYNAYLSFLKAKDKNMVVTQARAAGIGYDESLHGKDRPIDWDQYMKVAEEDGKKNVDNPFYIDNKSYKDMKLRIKKKKGKEKNNKKGYTVSNEYDDLRCFLNICKEMGIRPMLVMQPVNGYWYDHMKFPKEARQKYYANIRNIAKEYGVELTDLSDQEYTKYFFMDRAHPGRKGWVKINESLYKFYKEV